MKVVVKMYVAGQVYEEEYFARDYSDARKIAKSRNPTATIIGCNAKF